MASWTEDERAPAESIFRRAAEVDRRRNLQHADALDFLVYGDEDERHTEKCVHAEPCSRTYDPTPYRQTVGWTNDRPSVISRRQKALPAGDMMYAGTSIGALYGLPGSEIHAWQLAGWNVVPGSSR